MSCFNCEKEILNKETLFFCPNCLTQIKCKKCGEDLLKDAKGCVNCGTAISSNNDNRAVNNIEFEQKGDNKKFTASFTDHIGENLVASLSGLFLGNNVKANANPFAQKKDLQLPMVSKREVSFEEAEVVNFSGNELNDALTRVFKIENDKVSLVNSRLKQNGKKDHAIRISLLSLYAYSLVGQTQVSRSSVAELLKSAAVYDKNYLYWLSKCDEIKKVDSELLELNLPGRDAAIEVLKEFINPSIDKGSVHFSGLGTSKSGKRKKKEGKEESTLTSEDIKSKSTSSGSRMTPAKMIDILVQEKYFTERRQISEVITFCKDQKGQTLPIQTLSVALLRKVKSGTLKRHKNSSDNQYEYFQ
jgi:nucleoid DNA-binding protein/predicted RNA-binding Zn-ribbon protein involved in translation (DUF1610 family)